MKLSKFVLSVALTIVAACVPETKQYEPEQNLHNSRIPFVTERKNATYTSLARNIGRVNITFKEFNDGPVSSQVCTGTAIGGGYFISAYHCFAGRVVDASLETNALTSTTYATAAIDVPSLRQVSSGVDVAIGRFRGGRTPSGRTFTARPPVLNEVLFVLHHPNGLPLSVTDRRCKVSSLGDNKTFTHTCDTEKGSSGAFIFAKSDNAVVGIHAGGGHNRRLDNFAYHLVPLIERNSTIRSLFRRTEAALGRPTIEDFQAVGEALGATPVAAAAPAVSPVQNLHAFRGGNWQGLGRAPVREATEMARKYCSDSIGINCGRHGDWRIVAPPNHDPETIGIRVCGQNNQPYQLTVSDANNFTYRPISGSASPALLTQTSEFTERLRGFDRTSWGDRLLDLLDRQC
ncbi:trypsin-like peptidase domain-containing protein [Sulfitobacter mediterraneus]|uniref:trypsin-like serine peptidase n=1 Tax=Sulfitobacter mediterraneus TaxID=83219 RepID=UPI00193A3288|nr:serine protease [Sulfitobacter mediterraneus]MBM1556248.1 trypsin-like peptidase domain-containing protein [Sulfitobacter mediterraneus]MBM1567714.1 trypsin-like peptidase domain-containing protein [Sulfitobacter mediterraneus]MBM1571602.1 trypsin-like peptidase domain-containing protein [Sulfitobacter mediterraneus]MBM1575390.1 trypsin-like peptidase domain-containing protein [Sulfitobacter mediterraneus]MBM1579119.1 trypsin-like peptidase domain-containing protein [Sulfitobacter mediterra